MSRRIVVLLALAGVLSACGDDAEPVDGGPIGMPDASIDGGSSPLDAGLDAGSGEGDSGPDDEDGGLEPDAGFDLDAGFEDAGASDAGALDAGALDAGALDTGAPDGGPPPVDVVVNGSFELWDGALAVGWHGPASNIATDGVFPNTDDAHDGIRSARLINSSSTHRRFSTAPGTWLGGRYQCTYWVKGEGEIRNARFAHDDYSSYSSYTTLSSAAWREISYAFNLASTASDFELIFSVRSTSAAGLLLDDVRCARTPEPCDGVVCEEWQTCEAASGACITAADRCAVDAECPEHRSCELTTHTCELREGRCDISADCGDPGLLCETATRTCVPGDACSGVTCVEWRTCNPATVMCELTPGRCERHADCGPSAPVCDLGAHACVAAESPINVVPNGSFEAWEEVSFGSSTTTYLLPERWYGLQDSGPSIPETEIPAANVRQSSASPYDGAYAVQLVRTTIPAQRFTTERFTVQATRTYDCAYRVRGRGSIRHRTYCGGWGPNTTFVDIDSTEWQTQSFTMSGSSSSCVLVFYPSNTVAAAGHLELDGVVCTSR